MVIFATLIVFLIYIFKPNLTAEERTNFGWLIIVLILFSVAKNLVIVIWFGIVSTKKTLNSMFGGEDKEIDSFHTDDTQGKDINFSSMSDSAIEDAEEVLDLKEAARTKKMNAKISANSYVTHPGKSLQVPNKIKLSPH